MLPLAVVAAFVPAPLPALTPDELWQAFQTMAQASGMTLTAGSERRDGTVLVLSDVIGNASREGFGVTKAIPELRLRDLGDGTVEVTMSPEFDIRGAIAGASPADLSAHVTQSGLRALVSGTTDTLRIDASVDGVDMVSTLRDRAPDGGIATISGHAAGLALSIDAALSREAQAARVNIDHLSLNLEARDPQVEGSGHLELDALKLEHAATLPAGLREAFANPERAREIGPEAMAGAALSNLLSLGSLRFDLAFEERAGPSFAAAGNMASLSAELSASATSNPLPAGTLPGFDARLGLGLGTAEATLNFAGAPDGGWLRASARGQGGTATLNANLPPGLGESDFEQGPPPGLRILLEARDAGEQIAFEGHIAQAGDVTGNFTRDSGQARIALDGDGVSYDIAVTGMDYALSGPDLPAFVGLTTPELALSLRLPIHPAPMPQPAWARIDLRDLRISEGLWDLFDPTAVLPRDPIGIQLDAGAMLRVVGNVFSPDVGTDMPFQPESARLSTLAINGLGASLTGEGEVGFAYPDGLVPVPEGGVSFQAKGLYALLDRFAGLGLVGPDEMTGIRIGLAMIAKASGEDELRSEVRFGPDGSLTVNGMRMK